MSEEPEAAGTERPQPAASTLQWLIAVGIAVVGFGCLLLARGSPRLGLGAIVGGGVITAVGKRAAHHTLSQPLGLALLAVGVVLLLAHGVFDLPPVVLPVAIGFAVPGLVLAPHGPKRGF